MSTSLQRASACESVIEVVYDARSFTVALSGVSNAGVCHVLTSEFRAAQRLLLYVEKPAFHSNRTFSKAPLRRRCTAVLSCTLVAQ